MIKYWIAIAMVLAFRGKVMAQKNTDVAHVRTDFHFTVDLPYDAAAPLFGAYGEQKWSPDWKPQFLYPAPPADQEGAVFRIEEGPSHNAVWMTTVFDLPGGHVQHIYVLNHAVITRIDIRLARNGPNQTDVSVVYEWTALDPAANQHVKSFAGGGNAKAEAWKTAINAYGMKLKTAGAKR